MKKLLSYIAGVVLMTSMVSMANASTTCPECPSDLENLEATAYDSAVKLTWDEATDDESVAGYVISYGTESVDGDIVTDYEEEEDVGNVTEYVLLDMDNDTEYFFSGYAYDDDGNESEYWALEISATPNEAAGDYEDTDAPQVAKAEALDATHVEIVFSEAVVLPMADPENEFEIENDDTFEALEVLSAEMDASDLDEKTVILTTDEQEDGAVYMLTVGTGIEDLNGNILISGTSDTALFDGSGAGDDTDDDLTLVDVEVLDNTHVVVNFNKAVILDPIDPTEHFEITMKDDPLVSVDVLSVDLGLNTTLDTEDASALLETSEMEEGEYVIVVSDVVDEDGNDLDEDSAEAEFEIGAEGDDDDDDDDDDDVGLIDVDELMAEIVEQAELFLVKLTWDMPVGNDGLTVKQLVYMSEDGSSYDDEAELDADDEEYDVEDLEAGEYWFKLTQEDADGVETDGTFVKVVLSETGPGIIGLALVSLGLGRVFRKKRQ